MSGAIKKVAIAKGVNPITEVNEPVSYVVFRGGQKIIWRVFPAASSNTNNNFIFQIRPPSNTIINRHMKIRAKVQLTFTGTTSGGQDMYLIQSGYDAFRQFPIASITNSLSASINGTSVDIQLYDLIHAMAWYFDDREFKYGSSTMSPSMQDQSQQYDDLSGTSIRNPLASFVDSQQGANVPRGAFPYDSISQTFNNGVWTTVITATLIEDIYLSPFLYQSDYQKRGFYNIETLDMNWNLLASLDRIWSHSDAGGGSISNLDVQFTQVELLVNQIEQLATAPRPAIVQYNYNNYLRHVKDWNADIDPGDLVTISSNDISTGVIPSCLYIYVKRRTSDETLETADAYFAIENVSLLFNNDNTLFASASPEQLYEISAKNGLKMSYNMFSGKAMYTGLANTDDNIYGIGSVIKLNFGDDIPLELLDAVGMNKKCQIQVTVRARNLSNDAITPSLYVVQVNNGIFSITSQRTAYTQVGVVLQSDLLNIDNVPATITSNNLDASGSGVRKYLQPQKMLGYAKDIAGIAKDVAPYAKMAMGAGGSGGALLGGRRRKSKKGGRLIGADELRARLR